jgi:hypothetical protein
MFLGPPFVVAASGRQVHFLGQTVQRILMHAEMLAHGE